MAAAYKAGIHAHVFSTSFSLIRTITVGSGIAPDLLDPSDGVPPGARGLMCQNTLTAGREFHPAPRTVDGSSINIKLCAHYIRNIVPKDDSFGDQVGEMVKGNALSTAQSAIHLSDGKAQANQTSI